MIKTHFPPLTDYQAVAGKFLSIKENAHVLVLRRGLEQGAFSVIFNKLSATAFIGGQKVPGRQRRQEGLAG